MKFTLDLREPMAVFVCSRDAVNVNAKFLNKPIFYIKTSETIILDVVENIREHSNVRYPVSFIHPSEIAFEDLSASDLLPFYVCNFVGYKLSPEGDTSNLVLLAINGDEIEILIESSGFVKKLTAIISKDFL